MPTGAVTKGVAGLKNIPKTPGFLGFAIGGGIDALMGIKEGKSAGAAIFEGVANGALYTLFPGYWAIAMAPIIPSAVQGVINAEKGINSRTASMRNPNNMNFSYEDSNAAYTMRQASVQAIQGSKLNARSALGGEARLMHRGIPSNR